MHQIELILLILIHLAAPEVSEDNVELPLFDVLLVLVVEEDVVALDVVVGDILVVEEFDYHADLFEDF